jgi:hypothetical protein
VCTRIAWAEEWTRANQVLSLLETSKTTEAKTLLLRMIAGLSQSGLETRLEIGRLDGYRKVMKLLVEGEEGLSQEALMTLQHFLDVQEGQTTDGDAPPQLKEAIDQVSHKPEAHRRRRGRHPGTI